MRKLIPKITTIVVIFLTLTIVNCSNDYDDIAQHEQSISNEIVSKLTITNSTTLVSNLFFNGGISKIERIEEYDYLIFKPLNVSETKKDNQQIIVNSFPINLMDYEITIKNEFLYINDTNNFKLTFKNSKPYMISDQFTGYVENNNDILLNKDMIVALLFLEELTRPSETKVDYEKEISSIKHHGLLLTEGFDSGDTCSFWNTVYTYGIGLNEAAAYANFNFNNQNDLNSGELTNCTSIGQPQYTSLGVAHYYTQAYCCR